MQKNSIPPPPPENAYRDNLLLEIIKRYDFYTGTINNKGALIVAFHAFLLTSVILKWNEILAVYGQTPPVKWPIVVVTLCMIVLGALSVFSLFFTFKAIHPFRGSYKAPNKYHSNLFFDHVKEHADPMAYVDCLKKTTNEECTHDLAAQAHSLAKGLHSKFNNFDLSVKAILYGQLPAFAVMLLVKSYLAVISLF